MVEKCAHGHNVFEDTLRVPLIMSHSGKIQAGQQSDDLVELVDLYPTLLDLAGIDNNPGTHGLDGRSLAPTLVNREPVGRTFSVSENWSQAAVITERYKLGIWLDPAGHAGYPDSRSFGNMLFDLKSDPHELRNVYSDPTYAHVAKELEAHYSLVAHDQGISGVARGVRVPG